MSSTGGLANPSFSAAVIKEAEPTAKPSEKAQETERQNFILIISLIFRTETTPVAKKKDFAMNKLHFFIARHP
jgi:hypothetical protein